VRSEQAGRQTTDKQRAGRGVSFLWFCLIALFFALFVKKKITKSEIRDEKKSAFPLN